MIHRMRFVSLVVLVLLAGVAVSGLLVWSFWMRPVAPSGQVEILVEPGSSLNAVARSLEERGVIASVRGFKVLARLQGQTRSIQAGTYVFSESASPGAVLARLVEGDVVRYRFTVPEGLTFREVAAKLEQEGRGNAQNFIAMSRRADLIADLAPEATTLEGYLFPETYTLVDGESTEQVVRAMVRQFRQQVTGDLSEAATRKGLSLHQLVTMASIIQKEAGNEEEMPLISAVFHNRLKRRMPLQADPTVIYGLADFDGNLTRKDLANPHPYNTYKHRGLPPGPIACPGAAALQAAAAPASVDYLYFVARGDGTHYFSNTLKEHNRAVRRFQLRR